jgi:hypothetical protein
MRIDFIYKYMFRLDLDDLCFLEFELGLNQFIQSRLVR